MGRCCKTTKHNFPFNPGVDESVFSTFSFWPNVEYDWNLRLEIMDESDYDLDDKVQARLRKTGDQNFCHSSSLSPHDKLSLPAFSGQRDKLRLSYGMFTNQMYSVSTDCPSSPVSDAPPLPPRNAGKGSDSTPPPINKMSPITNRFEGILQQQSTASSTTKATLGPRVLPTLPQKFVLRKTETIHHPPVDKPSQPPEPVLFQKSPPGSDTPQKVPLPDKLQPGDLHPKPQVSELPPKPGELPPKPQLFDLPPKPQLGDLPPKPQLKDLPPKPLLSDLSIPKHGVPKPAHKPPPGEVAHKSEPCDMPVTNQQAEPSPQFTHSTEDTNGSLKSGPETPIPLPRKISTGKIKLQRVKTIYDCQADNDDELTFVEGEVIVVTGGGSRVIGHIGQPERKGVFPMSFVHILSD